MRAHARKNSGIYLDLPHQLICPERKLLALAPDFSHAIPPPPAHYTASVFCAAGISSSPLAQGGYVESTRLIALPVHYSCRFVGHSSQTRLRATGKQSRMPQYLRDCLPTVYLGATGE